MFQKQTWSQDSAHMFKNLQTRGLKFKLGRLVNFGVNTTMFRPIEDLRTNIDRDTIEILSTRNFEPVYNIETLIRATNLIREEYPNVRVTLIGTGSREKFLKDLVRKLDLEEMVEFKGKIENEKLPALINSTDIYVSTSLSDAGIASSTAEAMACGIYPIVTKVYDNDFWIIPGETGLLFEPESPVDLASKIKIAISSSSVEKAKVTTAARRKIQKDNDLFKEMMKMEKHMIELISNSKSSI